MLTTYYFCQISLNHNLEDGNIQAVTNWKICLNLVEAITRPER